MPTQSPSEKVLSFAYGSNMLTSRLQDRCPSAQPLGAAELHGYELKWHKRSVDGSGKCDAEKTDNAESVLRGVLFEIPLSEKPGLDEAEGLGSGYEERTVEVTLKGEQRKALLYYATKIDSSLKPYTWYKWLVVAGALEHGLSDEYIAQLEAIDAGQDTDKKRHDRYAKLSASYRGEAQQ